MAIPPSLHVIGKGREGGEVGGVGRGRVPNGMRAIFSLAPMTSHFLMPLPSTPMTWRLGGIATSNVEAAPCEI